MDNREERSVINEKNDGFQITGGITGGITDPSSLKALSHAELYYEEVRKNHSDVQRIAKIQGLQHSRF